MSQNISDQTSDNIKKRRRSLPLRTRLVLFVLLVALVPLTIIATRDILQTRRTLTDTAEISLKANALQTANNVDNFILTTLDAINGETRFPDFTAYFATSTPPQNVQDNALHLLTNLANQDSTNIISYALLDPKGTVLTDTLKSNIGKSEVGEPYFSFVRYSNKPVVSASTNSANGKTPGVTFATKVINLNGDYVGIIRVKYKFSIFQDVIVAGLGTSNNANDVSVLLLDPFYVRTADIQNPDLLLSKVPLDLKQIKQSFFQADITPKTPGDDTIAISYLHTLPWIVVYSRPTSVFISSIQREIRTNIIIVLSTLIIVALLTTLIARSLTSPIAALAKAANMISQGDLSARAQVRSTDEIGQLASAFNSMANELNQSFNILETRVAERTSDLEIARQQSENRARELQSIGEISKVISSEQKLELLLPLIARLVTESFGFYHTGIFLHEDTNQFTVLQAASSEGGKRMLAQSYRREVGGSGIVGYVAKFGTARIALDVGLDLVFFNNPELPNTRSEMALPLKLRDQIVGVIDIQSEEAGAFTENDANTLSILADQIAIAIENARLFTQLQQTLSEAQALSQNTLREGWLAFGRDGTSIGYHQSLRGGTKLMAPIETEEIRQALDHGKVLVFNKEGNTQPSSIVVPIKLRGQIIGTLNIQAPTPERRWSTDEVNLAEAISDRLSLALENARLIYDSQRQVLKEQKISDITSKIGTSVRTENILRTTAQELNQLLNGAEVLNKLRTNENGNGNGNGNQETSL